MNNESLEVSLDTYNQMVERYQQAIAELKRQRNDYASAAQISKRWLDTDDLKIEKMLKGELS